MKTPGQRQRAARFYALLIRLYPAAYQQSFGPQMLQTFRDYYDSVLEQEGRVGMGFWLALAAVALGAPSALALGIFLNQAGQTNYACAPVSGATSSAPAALISAQDWFARGDYDYDRGDCAKAIADYGQAIALKPDFAEAYN